MYQTFNPYTGADMRSIVPSPYATLGLGTDTTGNSGAGIVDHPKFVKWLHQHPEMATSLKTKRKQWVTAHPELAQKIKTRRHRPTGVGELTVGGGGAEHPEFVEWLQGHPQKADYLKAWRQKWVTGHPAKAKIVQRFRNRPDGMGAYASGITLNDEIINTHGTPGPNAAINTFPTQKRATLQGLGDESWLDSMFSGMDFSSSNTSVYSPPSSSSVGIMDSYGNVYNPSNPNNWWVSDSSTGGFDTTSLLNTLLGDANSIAKIVLTPGGSYTSVDPRTGQQISYQGTGQPSSAVGIPGFGTSLNSNWLLLAGAGLVVVLLMSKK